jgi:hypothetical protein
MEPLALSLQIKSAGVFSLAQFFDLFRIDVVRHPDRHNNMKQHDLSFVISNLIAMRADKAARQTARQLGISISRLAALARCSVQSSVTGF